jgi:hypothetical protein
MSSLISTVIQPRGYELIRNRICQILLDEFQAQLVYSGDYDLALGEIYMERLTPFDHTELPALNVGIERGDAESYHQGQSDWAYRFFIECNTRGHADGDLRGDTEAKVLVHKLMGVVQSILENPVYKTLGFPAGQLIKHRHIESFVFAESTRQDAENVTMARTILVVKSIETTQLLTGTLAQEWNTDIKLYETEKGYYWSRQI